MRRPWRNPVKCRRTDGRIEALSTGSQRTPQSEGQTKKTAGKSQQRRVTMDPRPRTTRTAESSNRGEAGLQEGETPSFHQGAQEICRATSRSQGLILKDCTSIVPLCIMSEQWEILHNKASRRYKRPERVMIPQHGH